jgi:hypothetical protein
VFVTLPHRLRVVADMARAASRECARVPNDSGRPASLLRSIAISADELADTLLWLDFASQGDVLKHLPGGQDYLMNTLPEVVNVLIRLSASVETAWQIGRETRGPEKFKELKQAIFWLRRLYEECGGRFTHTPRDKTHYGDGSPRSAAGRFILDFTTMCELKITPSLISAVMAEMVKEKNRRGEDPSDRQPNSSRALDASRLTCRLRFAENANAKITSADHKWPCHISESELDSHSYQSLKVARPGNAPTFPRADRQARSQPP